MVIPARAAGVMRFVDWFAGIGGFRLGLERSGHEHVASCELASFPRRVYAHRFGEPPTFEDVTRVKAQEIPEADLWCGGFPCQDCSAAGAGLGLLAGERSSLVWGLVGLAAVARPQWILLENVQGLLFKGRRYGRLLAVLARLGYGFAWRLLDAQFYGVAQRRKRVFLLACLGARAGMRRAAAVLLEPEGVRGDPPARRGSRADLAYALMASAGTSIKVESNYVARPLLAHGMRGDDEAETLIGYAPEVADPLVVNEQGTYTHEGSNNFRTRNVVAYTVPSSGANEHARQSPIAKTLDSNGAWGRAAGGTVVIPFSPEQVTHPENRSRCEPGSPAGTLSKGGHPESVADAGGRWVRRLMPVECERLQGFPDSWTDVMPKTMALFPEDDWADDETRDSLRYQALGNAVAVPVVEWIGRRLGGVS